MILSAVFSPDGRRILTGGADHSVKLWHVAGSELLTLTEDNADPAPIAFSPDGTSIATGRQDGTALVWRSATWQEIAGWTNEEAAFASPATGDNPGQ